MSTRQTIYVNHGPLDGPSIHIYRELMTNRIAMEIVIPFASITIPLPKDLQERMGIK